MDTILGSAQHHIRVVPKGEIDLTAFEISPLSGLEQGLEFSPTDKIYWVINYSRCAKEINTAQSLLLLYGLYLTRITSL